MIPVNIYFYCSNLHSLSLKKNVSHTHPRALKSSQNSAGISFPPKSHPFKSVIGFSLIYSQFLIYPESHFIFSLQHVYILRKRALARLIRKKTRNPSVSAWTTCVYLRQFLICFQACLQGEITETCSAGLQVFGSNELIKNKHTLKYENKILF